MGPDYHSDFPDSVVQDFRDIALEDFAQLLVATEAELMATRQDRNTYRELLQIALERLATVERRDCHQRQRVRHLVEQLQVLQRRGRLAA